MGQPAATLKQDGALLAIDTAGPTAGVAVYLDWVLAEVVWRARRRESAQLLSVIDTALRLAGIEKGALRAVAVAAGPGSYSGLRVGLATATGLALSLDIGIAQVPTLDLLASAAAGPTSVRAALDVGRGRYASARFHRSAVDVYQETPMVSTELRELADVAASEGATLVVDLEPSVREHLVRAYGDRLALASPAASARRPGFLAELADRRMRRGALTPSLALDPVYVS